VEEVEVGDMGENLLFLLLLNPFQIFTLTNSRELFLLWRLIFGCIIKMKLALPSLSISYYTKSLLLLLLKN
jgi:hypothetical protein